MLGSSVKPVETDAEVQPISTSAPLISGLAPLPYAPKIMGLPAEPEDGIVSVSRQAEPLLKRMESPGLKVEELTFAIVRQGVELEVPLFESLPPTESM
jgi:hypothetical protein